MYSLRNLSSLHLSADSAPRRLRGSKRRPPLVWPGRGVRGATAKAACVKRFLLDMLLAVPGLLCGFYLVFLQVGEGLREQFDSARFASVPGQLTTDATATSFVRATKNGNQVTWTVHVTYRFTVDGKEHVGHRLGFSNAFPFGNVGDWVGSHKAGTPVTVYYDPADPRRCVLSRGLSAADHMALAFLTFGGFLAGWLSSVLCGILVFGQGPTSFGQGFLLANVCTQLVMIFCVTVYTAVYPGTDLFLPGILVGVLLAVPIAAWHTRLQTAKG